MELYAIQVLQRDIYFDQYTQAGLALALPGKTKVWGYAL